MSNTFDKLGHMSIVEQADLENLVSAANRRGDTRKGGDSMGKRAGTRVLMRATADDTLKEVFALGADSSDAWRVIDGSANVTPVNLDLATDESGWTIGATSTYDDGLLTTGGTAASTDRVVQSVNLKAGTYFVSGEAAGEGTTADCDVPRLRIGTAEADDTYGSFTGSLSFLHATAAEDLATKEPVGFTFTLTADDEVFFTIDNVDEAGALQAGSSYLLLNLLEAA